jgi:hypothetical protein
MIFESNRLRQLAGLKPIKESNMLEKPIKEDWENYQSIEDIQKKYLEKRMLAIGISISDDRLPSVTEIFKTALEDAKTFGATEAQQGVSTTEQQPADVSSPTTETLPTL